MSPFQSKSIRAQLIKIAPLAALGFMAILLRFWNLEQRGLYHHDEGTFLENGRYYSALFRQGVHVLFTQEESWTSLLDTARNLWVTGGSPWMHAKPAYEWSLVALCTLFNPSDQLGLYYSATLGALTILLPALFLRMKNYPNAGFFTSALLMGSVFHLHYSRSAMSQALSFFWVTASVIFILNALEKNSISPKSRRNIALSLGIALTTHYNLIWFPAFALSFLAIWEWEGISSWRKWLWQGIVGIGWMALPALIFEIPHQLFLWLMESSLNHAGLDADRLLKPFPSYFQQAYDQIAPFSTDKSLPPLSTSFFPKIMYSLESLPVFLLLGIGLIFPFWLSFRKKIYGLFLSGLIVIPFILWTRVGYPGPRSFLPILFPLGLGAGLLLAQLTKFFRPRLAYAVVWVFLIAVFALQYPKTHLLIQGQSPWKKASLLLKTLGERACFAERGMSDYNRPILRFYAACGSDSLNPPLQAFLSDGTELTSEMNWPERSDLVDSFYFSSGLNQSMLMEESLEPEWIEKYRNGSIANTCNLRVFKPQ